MVTLPAHPGARRSSLGSALRLRAWSAIAWIIATIAICAGAHATPTITREDVRIWIEPDQDPAFGVYDWSRHQRPITSVGSPGFSVDHLAFDGADDHLIVIGALSPTSLTASGMTIAVVFRCPQAPDPGDFLFSLRAGNGAVFTDCSVAPSGAIRGRCSTTIADGDAATPGATLPGPASFPSAASHTYLAAIRWDPGAAGTFRVSLVRAGDTAAQVTASTAVQTGCGNPDAADADLYLGCRGDGTPADFGAWSLVRAICLDRAATDAELAALVPADGDEVSFIDLALSAAEGFILHTDPTRLDAANFQAAVWEALSRNVHIVVGPGESHCGSAALTVGTQPGIDNILKHACGRAVGLTGCGLTGFDVLPLTPSSFTSVHHIPFNASGLSAAWTYTNGTVEQTTGIWNTLGDPSVRRSTPAPGARSISHLQREAIVGAYKSTVGIDAMNGMANVWDLITSERFDEVSIYVNTDIATGSYRISGLVDGGDYNSISDWTTTGPMLATPPGDTLTVQRFATDPTWDGFAIENIGGTGSNMRLGFLDAHSPDPGIRVGCDGVAIGGGRMAQINQQVWFPLMQSARVDYVGLCLSVTNDSSRSTPYSDWWNDVQTIVRTTIALSGPDGQGGTGRTHGIWIPVEGNLLPGNRVRQRIMCDLLASLAVELDIDLVSFPMFVPTYDSGATTLYDGVHVSANEFGTVARMFELNVMPWAVPEFAGACCFSCAELPISPCPDPRPIGPVCLDNIPQLECEDVFSGVYRGDGSTCLSSGGIPVCRCPADLDGDGMTNAADFVILASNFGAGTPQCTLRGQGDLNCDGVVNAADFTILAGNIGCQ